MLLLRRAPVNLLYERPFTRVSVSASGCVGRSLRWQSTQSGDPWPTLQSLQELRQQDPANPLFNREPKELKHARFDGECFHSVYPSIQQSTFTNIASFMLDARGEADRPKHDQTWFISADASEADGQAKERFTFKDVKEKTAKLSGMFAKQGLKRDQVVVLHAPNHVDYAAVCWAAFRLGGIIALTSPSSTAGELTRQLELVSKQYSVHSVISHAEGLDTATEAVEKSGLLYRDAVEIMTIDGHPYCSLDSQLGQEVLQADQVSHGREKVAFLAFSSGTTGLPKAVEISHGGVIDNVLQFYEAWKNNHRITPGESVSLGILPFCHIYGLIVVLHFNLYARAALVIQKKFQPRQFLNLIESNKISHLWLVPPLAQFLSKLQDREPALTSVRHLIIGAAPVTERVFTELRRVMPQCDSGQDGLTETSVVVSVYPGAANQPFPAGAAGALISDVSAKIVDPITGTFQSVGQTGELWSRSPSNALRYLSEPESTAATWDENGFCHTGDEAFFGDDGALFLTDRIKELIKVKGFPVAPGELEDKLKAHPLVQDVCVVGKPSRQTYARFLAWISRGEIPWAFVVLADESSDRVQLAEELKKLVAVQTSSYKHLGQIHFIEQIPRNAAGKALRRDLKQRL